MSRSTLDTSPDFHIRLLDQLLAVIPYVLLPDDISFPVLWPTDLHTGNIMVKPKDKPDVVCILDCQGMSVAPLNTLSSSWLWTISRRPKANIYIKRQLRTIAILHKRYKIPIVYNSPCQHALHEYPQSFVQRIEDMVRRSPPPRPISHRNSEQLGCHRGWDTLSLSLRWAGCAATLKRAHDWKSMDDVVCLLAKELGDGWVSNERYEEV